MNMEKKLDAVNAVCSTHDLVSFWDFQEPADQVRVAKGASPYELIEVNGPVSRKEDGIFGPYSAQLNGQWFRISRADCPALNFAGSEAKLTIMAWLKWRNSESTGCQAVAGIWDETNRKRQYCLFLDLRIWESKHQVCGHVSSVGGPTPGYMYCMTSAIGNTALDDKWHVVAFTYDGMYAKVYLDGVLDEREQYNPYFYPEGLYDAGEDGADFTVGAVDRSGQMGNFYNGLLGGLAIFNRALSSEEISSLHKQTML